MSTTPELVTRNPAHPSEIVGTFAADTPDGLAAKVGVAASAAREWTKRAPVRAAALNRWAAGVEANADRLASLVAAEVGKPIGEAHAEVGRVVAILRYYAQAAFDPVGEIYPSPDGNAELLTERLPLGSVLVITPWNFPLAIPAWKIAPALAYGNAVLFKPSSAALASAHALVELAADHLPSGILQTLVVPADRVDGILVDPRVAGVSFTGSVEVGRHVTLTVVGRGGVVQAEMGGQNPSIVLDDADLGRAATTIAGAAMGYAGQKCTATSRVVVTERVASAFIPMLVDAVQSLPVGDPRTETTMVGPLISEGAREAVDQAVRGARSRGATLLSGGRPAVAEEGWFYEPTLVSLEDFSDPFAQEETFGPAASVLVAADDIDAVAIANGTRFGLSAAVFGTDIGRARAVARRLTAGMIRINASTTGVDFYAPFGGEKASSYGPREQGRAAREFYTRTRTVTVAGAVQ